MAIEYANMVEDYGKNQTAKKSKRSVLAHLNTKAAVKNKNIDISLTIKQKFVDDEPITTYSISHYTYGDGLMGGNNNMAEYTTREGFEEALMYLIDEIKGDLD